MFQSRRRGQAATAGRAKGTDLMSLWPPPSLRDPEFFLTKRLQGRLHLVFITTCESATRTSLQRYSYEASDACSGVLDVPRFADLA